jgi:hypothetical protein
MSSIPGKTAWLSALSKLFFHYPDLCLNMLIYPIASGVKLFFTLSILPIGVPLQHSEVLHPSSSGQSYLSTAPYIDLDLKEESESNDDDGNGQQQHERSIRQTTPRQFLIPGTHSKEIDIRKQQYSNLCLDNLMEGNDNAILILDCMESQVDDETKLMKELELLTACALSEEPNDEVLTPAITNDQDVNLAIPDPKSQNDIDRMDPKDAIRFNNATILEVNGMKGKNVFVNATLDDLPQGTTIYQSVVNWTSKTNLGVYLNRNAAFALVGIATTISVREYSPNGKEYYWLLKKTIYGHPKASRLWAECLHKKLVELGYTQF